MQMRVHFPSSNLTRRRHALVSVLILTASVGAGTYLVLSPTNRSQKPDGELALGAAALAARPSNLDFARALPNLTGEFADRALEQLIAQNKTVNEGGTVDVKNLKLLPEKEDVNSIVSKIIDGELANEEVKISDLKVNASDTKELQLAYLIFINQALQTQGEEMPDVMNSSLTSYFADTAAKLDETAEILKAVKAPPSWLGIHRNLVAFFLKQRNIYRSLGAADTDPLRFYIAATRLLPQEAEREFQNIQTAINKKIVDEKLI